MFPRRHVCQISFLIKAVHGEADQHLGLVDWEHVEIHENLPQMICARAVPTAPVDAPMIAAGLPFQALSPWGREAQSIAFFNTPDTDQLYSGVTNRIAFASRIRLFNSVTLAGGFCSSSWLNGGMPSSSNVSTVAPLGASSVAARSAARLYDPRRRLPAIPRNTNWCLHSRSRRLIFRTGSSVPSRPYRPRTQPAAWRVRSCSRSH